MTENSSTMSNGTTTAGTLENRFLAWTAVACFSAVSLGAHISWDWFYDTAKERWVTAFTSLSMIIAFLAMVAHFVAPDAIIGKPAEAATASLLALFWTAGLPVVMNPDNAIAVGIARVDNMKSFTILNANLYFGCWLAFLSVVYILGGYVRDIGYDITRAPPKTAAWFAITSGSVVVLGSSCKFFYEFCDEDSSTPDCVRTKYGIALGCFGFVLSAIMCLINISLGSAGFMVELVMSFIVFALNCAGIGLITFGWGPGTFLGNLYFFTWLIWGISGYLLLSLVTEFMGGGAKGNSGIEMDTGAGGGARQEAPQPIVEETITSRI